MLVLVLVLVLAPVLALVTAWVQSWQFCKMVRDTHPASCTSLHKRLVCTRSTCRSYQWAHMSHLREVLDLDWEPAQEQEQEQGKEMAWECTAIALPLLHNLCSPLFPQQSMHIG